LAIPNRFKSRNIGNWKKGRTNFNLRKDLEKRINKMKIRQNKKMEK